MNNDFFGIKVSQPNVDVTSASPNQLIMSDDYSQRIYYSNTGVPTVLLGLRTANSNNGIQHSQQGLFVSQSGIDVTQASNSQMSFNSSQDSLKIAYILQGNYTMTSTDLTNGYVDTVYSHNLGFKPVVIGSFYNTTDNLSRQLPYTFFSPGASYYNKYGGSAVVCVSGIDTYNIYIAIRIFDIAGLAWLTTNTVLTFEFYCQQETIVS